MGSKVYYTDMRARPGRSLLDKLRSLMKAAGMEEIDFQDKFVAIKLHFGEPGNLSFLRLNFARAVADEVKRLGGKPFLTDCNTLPQLVRQHAALQAYGRVCLGGSTGQTLFSYQHSRSDLSKL